MAVTALPMNDGRMHMAFRYRMGELNSISHGGMSRASAMAIRVGSLVDRHTCSSTRISCVDGVNWITGKQ